MKAFAAATSAATTLATLFCAAAALAQDADGPRYAFDAVYTQQTMPGSFISSIRMLSDGQGKLRTDTETRGQKSIAITDYKNLVGYNVIENQKMVLRYRLRGGGNTIRDDASARRIGAKAVGVQVIGGHPSHGWEYNSPQGKTTVWIGDDIDYVVKSQTVTPTGATISMDLKMASRTNPPPSVFAIPSGYKLVNVMMPPGAQ